MKRCFAYISILVSLIFVQLFILVFLSTISTFSLKNDQIITNYNLETIKENNIEKYKNFLKQGLINDNFIKEETDDKYKTIVEIEKIKEGYFKIISKSCLIKNVSFCNDESRSIIVYYNLIP